MSQEQAFFDDIRDHPDDDTPRLVLADWLEEHGQPERAELIRVQIELARGDLDPTSEQQWRKREAALWKKHSRVWARSLRAILSEVRFQRGFLDQVTMDAHRFLHQGDD